jgi:hypothetical protein
MNDSSAQPDYSITSTDTITLTSSTGSSYYYNTGAGTGGFSSDTITITGGGSGYTIGGAGVSSITLNDINTSSFNWKMPEEFVDAFPDYGRIQKMCKAYPALEIAMRNFKTVYDLVKDDYDSPTPKK